jgi:hypothetical protein
MDLMLAPQKYPIRPADGGAGRKPECLLAPGIDGRRAAKTGRSRPNDLLGTRAIPDIITLEKSCVPEVWIDYKSRHRITRQCDVAHTLGAGAAKNTNKLRTDDTAQLAPIGS